MNDQQRKHLVFKVFSIISLASLMLSNVGMNGASAAHSGGQAASRAS